MSESLQEFLVYGSLTGILISSLVQWVKSKITLPKIICAILPFAISLFTVLGLFLGKLVTTPWPSAFALFAISSVASQGFYFGVLKPDEKPESNETVGIEGMYAHDGGEDD